MPKKFMDLLIKQQASVFGKMVDDVAKKFPKDIRKQATALGKAFDKMTGTTGTYKKAKKTALPKFLRKKYSKRKLK